MDVSYSGRTKHLSFKHFKTYTNRKELNVKLIVDASNLQGRISRHVYGQFSEHLGHCIYDGLYVGKNPKSRTSTACAKT